MTEPTPGYDLLADELVKRDAEIERLTVAREMMQLDAEKYRDEAIKLRADNERLRATCTERDGLRKLLDDKSYYIRCKADYERGHLVTLQLSGGDRAESPWGRPQGHQAMTLSARQGSHGPSELTRLDRENAELRAEIERLRAIEDAATDAATYFYMSDGGEEDFDEQRMVDLMAKLGRALEPKL